jgi:hypothetical protein
MPKVLTPTTNNPNLIKVQDFVKIEWDHAHDQTSISYPWTIKWKDQTLFSSYQSFGIRVKDVHIYMCVNTLICHRVGNAQNVCLVIDVSTLIVTKMCLLNIVFF